MLQKFAFALSSENLFLNRHFGDADKFHFFEKQDNKNLIFVGEQTNPFKDLSEAQGHGSNKKGILIIDFLKKQGVQALVSKQFGPNIKMVHQHFIPIKIGTETPGQVQPLLEKNLHWLEEEWNTRSGKYHLFTIQNGIVKLAIRS